MILVSRVDPEAFDPAAGDLPSADGTSGAAAALYRVTEAATVADGQAPLNEAALLTLRRHGIAQGALWLAEEDGVVVGFALASRAPEARAPRDGHRGPVELNLVVAPDARRRGAGRALADIVLDAFGPAEVTAWSHGSHPGAARLAAACGLDRVRDLWLMRRPLSAEHPLPEATMPRGVVVRPFQPGRDEDAFLAANAEAFIGHPEQAAMTPADLEARMAESWFDPAGFFLAEPADAPSDPATNEAVESPPLLGFHWTKVHAADPPYGEVYVVAVSPAAQGHGLGKALTLTGLHYLAERHVGERGLGEVVLYVEADNAPAIAIYQRLGFTHAEADTDVMYRRRPTPARA